MSTTRNPEVVVITGASAGNGRAIVRAFAKRGAHIGLLARGHAGLEAACREVEAIGGKAIVIPTDVADPDQVEAAAAKVEETFGPIDIWVNDAMTAVFAPAIETKPEEFQRVTEVTYLGYVYGTLAALRRMLPRNSGRIIQVGSDVAYRSIPLQSSYSGAKHAIRGFTDSVRTELIHYNSHVKISMVQIPGINTPQFTWCRSRLPKHPQPVPPIYEPEVVADAVTYLADHYRRELWVSWMSVIVIVGNKLFPGLADWYLGKTGFKSQQTDLPVSPNRPDNLLHPVDENRDYGARGVFTDRAHDRSFQLWLDTHPGVMALIGAGILSLVGTLVFWRKR
jgi:NAD(P)-dependent dehydrogenase (short-subunit alcohol dehydrogenase family)